MFNHAFIDQDVSCPICFEEYSGDPAKVFVGYIRRCGHYFHFDCIWKWLESNQNCPLCREEVLLKEDDIKGISLGAVCEIQQHAEQQNAARTQDVTESSCSVVCETENETYTTVRPDELVLKVPDDQPSTSINCTPLENTDIAEVHKEQQSTESPSSLGHLSVINMQQSPEAGTIASGAAYPGCGTHELDVRESLSDYSDEEAEM